jgi:circadian clock protein KaiC
VIAPATWHRRLATLARMNDAREISTSPLRGIRKTPTGIDGLDAITGGGVPSGRPTLIAGGAGCGKTLFAMTFLVQGAQRLDEPGVFVTFEEKGDELALNVASLGYDLPGLVAAGRLAIEHIDFDPAELEEAGEYDLDGLFIRLAQAIASIGAKRVVLDTVEVLLGGLANTAIVRAELRRLFDWLKDQGVTAIITAERGAGALTRSGLEEYVSDCVILLDQRVRNEIATRRLRIIKYRGSAHGTNEYPFIIDEEGISVFPVTSVGLMHAASDARMPSGIEHLDAMLGGDGFYRGSSILISGTAGAGKSSFGAASPRPRACAARAASTSPSRSRRAR